MANYFRSSPDLISTMSANLSFQDSNSPLPTTIQPRRAPRKLRETCDACASSKVRCGREQPKCSRCISQRLACNYSLSRRMGKRRASSLDMLPAFGVGDLEQILPSRGSSSSFMSPTLTPGSFSTEDSGSSASVAGQHQTLAGPISYTGSLGLDIWASGTGTALDDEDIMALHQFDLNDLMNSEFTPPDADVFSPIDPATLETWLNIGPKTRHADSLFSGNLETLQQSLTPSRNASRMTNSPSAPFASSHGVSDKIVCPLSATATINDLDSKDCVNTILSVLQIQYLSPYSCSVSAVDRPNYPTVDQVLNGNKSALASISAVLKCSCASDPVTSMLLTLLISKMLGWYSAILRGESTSDRPPTPGASTPDSNHPKQPTHSLHEERVLHLPISVGSFTMSHEDESRIRAQLVLTELSKVVRIVERMTDQPGKGDGNVSMRESCGGNTDLATGLETHLKMRLRRTVQEAMEQVKVRRVVGQTLVKTEDKIDRYREVQTIWALDQEQKKRV